MNSRNVFLAGVTIALILCAMQSGCSRKASGDSSDLGTNENHDPSGTNPNTGDGDLGDPTYIPQSPYASDGSTTTGTVATGTSALEDGSAARIARYGEDQYFWGDLYGDSTLEPIVKITHAYQEGTVTDVEITFNPDFVDLTYGANVVGWNKHSFAQLVGSDHVQVAFVNGDGDTVLVVKLDLLSLSPAAPSGYASLGIDGDGELIYGEASDILSFGSSFDDNLNYYGYQLFESSPPTDSAFSTNTEYPNWEYYAEYRITIDSDAFGPSGYGEVHMTSVHASPSKNGIDTVPVKEGPPPPDTDDPFKYTVPGTYVPPDTTTVPDTTAVPDTTTVPADTTLPD